MQTPLDINSSAQPLLANYCDPDGANESFSSAERNFILVTDVALSSAISVMGVLLNALSIAVLQRDVRRSSMSVLLLALSIFDMVFIALSAPYTVVYMGLGVLVRTQDGSTLQNMLNTLPAVQTALPIVWYLGSVARTGRNWVILIVALDRFMVVQNPFLSSRRSNPRRSRLYASGTTALALLYNAPLLFEFILAPSGCPPVLTSKAMPERFGDVYMMVYKKIMYLAFLSVGPVLWLLVFNVLLIRSLLVASRIRAAITREATRRTEDTKMLVVIIAVFLATETPGAVWQVLLDTSFEKGTWFYSYFYSLATLLTLVNSAVNFFIYCVWSRNFRRNMIYVVKRRPKPPARVVRFESDSDRSQTRQVLLMTQRPAGRITSVLQQNHCNNNGASPHRQHLQQHLGGGSVRKQLRFQ